MNAQRKTLSAVQFICSFVIGIGFFLWPFSYGGKTSVLFDIVTSFILKSIPAQLGFYSLALIVMGAAASMISTIGIRKPLGILAAFKTSTVFLVFRIAGAVLACLMFFKIGPAFLLEKGFYDVMWQKLVLSVGVVIPLGAVVVALLLNYGALDFVGTLMRPVMRPLFRLPGRSALDDLMSWLGPYSVGLYFTKRLLQQGIYNRREAYTVCICFCTVSVGFVGVVASTLNILSLFPIIFLTYFFVVYFVAVILVRIWPLSVVPQTYVGTPQIEEEPKGGVSDYFKMAWRSATERAATAPGIIPTVTKAFLEGVILTSTILGMILAIGTLALLIANHTPIFKYLAAPLVPVFHWLGFANEDIVAQATVAGITEVYIPALLAKDAAVASKFFVAVLSISQIIFFSSVAPMMLEMFREIPIRAYELILVFIIRTVLLIPLLTAIVGILRWTGVF